MMKRFTPVNERLIMLTEIYLFNEERQNFYQNLN